MNVAHLHPKASQTTPVGAKAGGNADSSGEFMSLDDQGELKEF